MSAQPVIILVEPQLAENIGAAARAMLNCGLTELRLVHPRPEWPNERARANSSGAEAVLDAASLFRSVGEATADLQRVYASTGRGRDLTKLIMTPPQAAAEMRAEIGRGERVGVLFGPERTGPAQRRRGACRHRDHGAAQPRLQLAQSRPGGVAGGL